MNVSEAFETTVSSVPEATDAPQGDAAAMRPPGCNAYCVFAKFAPIHVYHMAALLPLVLLGNGLTIASVCRYKWMRTNCNMLVAALAVADIFRVAYRLGYVYIIAHQWRWVRAHRMQYAFINLGMALADMSGIAHVFLIGLDRFVAIFFPLRYLAAMTPRAVGALIAGAWGASLLVAGAVFALIVLPMRGVPLGVQPIVIITYLYDAILVAIAAFHVAVHVQVTRVALRQRAARQGALRQTAEEVEMRVHTAPSGEDAPGENKWFVITRADLKATRMMLMVLGTFGLCWTPFLVGFTAVHVAGSRSPVMGYVVEVGSIVEYSQAMVHVVIYGLCSVKFRAAFRAILRCETAAPPGGTHSNASRQDTSLSSVQ